MLTQRDRNNESESPLPLWVQGKNRDAFSMCMCVEGRGSCARILSALKVTYKKRE